MTNCLIVSPEKSRYLIPHLLELYEKEDEDGKKKLLEEIRATLETEEYRLQLFQSWGNGLPLQWALLKLQRLLLDAKETDKLLEYAKMYHDEPDRLYQKQIENLKESGKKGDWENIVRIIRMFETPKDKVMLMLKGVWSSGKQRTKVTSQAFSDALKLQLKAADDRVLEKFSELSVKE